MHDAGTRTSDPIDFEALARDVAELQRTYIGPPDDEDFEHLKKLERWVNRANTLGYATAWLAPNLISALLLSTSTFGRWAVLSHHISHKAFDRIPGIPERYTSRGWAKGASRWRDWADWIEPEAWHEEHDLAHHYRLGEEADPDLVEERLGWLRESRLPKPAKLALSMVLGAVWKPFYYAPNTLKELRAVRARRAGQQPAEESLTDLALWMPWTPQGRELWGKSWLPYGGRKFAAIPAMFAPLGPWAVFSVWANSLLAEVLTNLHAFVVIVPNHSGDDVMRFDTPTRSKGEFYYRQIAGSVNYRTAGDFNDFLHGWLNYQIEHHLFPRATPKQLQRLQAPVKALCEKHNIPYIQEPVTRRLRKMLDIMVGARSMLRPEPVAS